MNSNSTILVVSSLSLICSASTLGLVILGAVKGMKAKKELEHKINVEMNAVKSASSRAVQNMKSALDAFEL